MLRRGNEKCTWHGVHMCFHPHRHPYLSYRPLDTSLSGRLPLERVLPSVRGRVGRGALLALRRCRAASSW